MLFTVISLVGMYLVRYLEVYPSLYGEAGVDARSASGRSASRSASSGLWGHCYLAFMNAFPRVRAVLMTSPYRDEVQVPVNSGDDGAAAGARVAQFLGFSVYG